MKRAALLLAFSSLAVLGVPASASAAHTREECLDSAVVAQRLLKARKLLEAHASLVMCASEECPRVVRRDCAQWLTEADAAQPTVVIALHDARDRDVTDARVTIDAQPMPDALGGRAIPLDPGMHSVKVERDGATAVTEQVVVREGEKARSIVIRLPAKAGEDWAKVQPAPAEPSPSRKEEVRAPVSPITYVLAGIGVVGLGTFAVMGLKGLSDRNSLCTNGTCPPSAFDQVRTQYIVADIGLGVGAVSLALAAWTLLTRGQVPAETRTASTASHP
ncbi:hypothetical protein AKJ09_09314 [Labilithrix luteola]|uniref:Uncharacterized protein n=1 Tax=Labilithrix luteola TaxID=1391654 RepID=A0A0K1QA31_9BACT|nr:hypothetical protein [Labilithrix luteola]AKV02651.1 hypothetical protein AKJ09_09314 [Labilithrix luteola]